MVASDESYRDPTNLQSKLQKHQAFEAELSANKGRVDTICKVTARFRNVDIQDRNTCSQWHQVSMYVCHCHHFCVAWNSMYHHYDSVGSIASPMGSIVSSRYPWVILLVVGSIASPIPRLRSLIPRLQSLGMRLRYYHCYITYV